MEYDTGRRVNCQGRCTRNAVVRLDKFHADLSQIHCAALLYNLSLRLLQQPCFLQLVLDQSHGQLRRINRNIHLRKNIGKRADVIFMSVRDHKALHLLLILYQVADVRNNLIDTWHIIVREGHTAVHDNNRIVILDRGDIHADLIQSSQRNNSNFLSRRLLVFLLFAISGFLQTFLIV